ncbi:1968_t:CDS:2 [Acaulospora colombiana]|uniref:1968_t:CDS:1 n=1 Tax=Acaulospora colombiana TaxID=27376 RepID=A0ACA9KJJ8_9GLOM|nr:1968_t:CDS:2 [Acaulospora colombiana]
MALQPSLSPFVISGPLDAPHTLEFFYCFVCVHSARSANTLETIIKPLLEQKYAGKVKVIFRPQVQPWWPSSSIAHEASLAVAKVAPQSWWNYAVALFANRPSFTDVPTSTLTPPQLREKLANFGLETGTLTQDEVNAVKGLLTLKPSGGIGVTDDLKYCCKSIPRFSNTRPDKRSQ